MGKILGISLTSATTVPTIREIPPQLWSHEAVARIVGGVAKLIPDTQASLPRSSLGTATIRAIVPLGSPLPPSVLVKDSNGDSVLVSIDYGKLPHLCPNCNSYGHQSHRCPKKCASVALTAQHPSSQDDTSITEAPTLSSNITSPNLRMIQSQAENNPDVNRPTAPSVAEMEVDGPLTTVNELPQSHLPSSPATPLPLDSSQLLISQTDPELQNYIDLPPSEIHTYQVSLLNSPSDDSMMPVPIDTPVIPVIPPESSTHQDDNSNQTTPADDQTEFTFPPPLSCALNPVIDPSSASQSSNECSQVQLKLDTYSTDKREGNSDKRKTKFDLKASLRCTSVTHQFKPKGVVEKRRKKANNVQVPSDEQVQQCLLELQSDKVYTLYFDALDAHKVLRNIQSENHEAGKT